MEERKFNIVLDNNIIAANMSLQFALLFVKAYFEEYFNETSPLQIVPVNKPYDSDFENNSN